jgi:hypothetical protein
VASADDELGDASDPAMNGVKKQRNADMAQVGYERVIQVVVNKLGLQSVTSSCCDDLYHSVMRDTASRVAGKIIKSDDSIETKRATAAIHFLGFFVESTLTEMIKKAGLLPEYEHRVRESKRLSGAHLTQRMAGIWIDVKERRFRDKDDLIFGALEKEVDEQLKSEECRNRLLAIAGEYVKPLPPDVTEQPSLVDSASVGSWLIRHSEPSGRGAVDPSIRHTIQALAEVVHGQLREQEAIHKVNDPFSMPVRWRDVTDVHGDHSENVISVQGVAGNIQKSGTIDDISDLFRLASRLVILGQPGAGKTVLMTKLASDILRANARDPHDPVPVIFQLASWDSDKQVLLGWLIDELVSNYRGALPQLEGVAERLIESGHILPLLDGFDEMDLSLRPGAINAINASLAEGDRFVIASREDEYVSAYDASDVLTGATVIKLDDLAIDDVKAYLPLTAAPRRSADGAKRVTKWDDLLESLSMSNSDKSVEPLVDVLRSPLMVSLARSVYSDTAANPNELLDASSFPNSDAIRDHLFDNFIKAKYERLPRGGARGRFLQLKFADAKDWLTHVAITMYAQKPRSLPLQEVGEFPKMTIRGLVDDLLRPVLLMALGVLLTQAYKFSILPLNPQEKTIFQAFGWFVAGGSILSIASLPWRLKGRRRRHRNAVNFARRLEDAYRRGVLRRVGRAYQFKHALLHDRLALKAFTSPVGVLRYSGPDEVCKAGNRLAASLVRAGKTAEAEKVMRQALVIRSLPPWKYKRHSDVPVDWSVEYSDGALVYNARPLCSFSGNSSSHILGVDSEVGRRAEMESVAKNRSSE